MAYFTFVFIRHERLDSTIIAFVSHFFGNINITSPASRSAPYPPKKTFFHIRGKTNLNPTSHTVKSRSTMSLFSFHTREMFILSCAPTPPPSPFPFSEIPHRFSRPPPTCPSTTAFSLSLIPSWRDILIMYSGIYYFAQLSIVLNILFDRSTECVYNSAKSSSSYVRLLSY